MMHAFVVSSVVRGYHEYKDIWSAPIDGVELPCKREPGNPRDTSAVAVIERNPSGELTLGHVPRLISAICSIFIRRGGVIVCIVTGTRQYSMDLPQGGLEIPCRYIFRTNNQAESDKTRKLVETVLEITIEPTSLEAQTPKQTVDTSTSKEVPAVTTPMHADFPTSSTDLQIQCSHCSTDPVPVVTINEETNNEPEPPPKKRKLSDIATEGIIMGEELCDADINLAQRLLGAQFPELGGLQSTLLQQKEAPILEKKEKMLQIIHCPSRHHWIVATTVGNNGDGGKVLVYDSIFKKVDRETRKIIYSIFQLLPVSNVKVVKAQKQMGTKDCGLFAIAYATALAFGQNPSKLRFRQESMRSHFVACLEEDKLIPFP